MITIKTIAILTLKGGTGKTTTARQMAHVLATDYGKRVLLVDLDPSGNLSASFGLRPEKAGVGDETLYGCAALLHQAEADVKEYIVSTKTPGVDLIPTNDSMKQADTFLRATSTPQPYRLRRHLDKVQEDYDFCILDCPHHEDLVVFNALVAAREVIAPATVGQDAMDGTVRAFLWIQEDVDEFNPSLVFRGVLKTKIGANNLDKEGAETPIRIPGTGKVIPQFKTYIRSSVDAERCRFMCMALKEYSKSMKPAIDYDNFVAEYLGLPPVHTKNVPYL